MTIPMIRQAFAPRASITTLNLKLSQTLMKSNKSEHSNYNDPRRMSQKSQTSHKVPSLDLSHQGGGSGDGLSRGHSGVVGTLEGSASCDVLVDADEFGHKGDAAMGPGNTGTTGSGGRHHPVITHTH